MLQSDQQKLKNSIGAISAASFSGHFDLATASPALSSMGRTRVQLLEVSWWTPSLDQAYSAAQQPHLHHNEHYRVLHTALPPRRGWALRPRIEQAEPWAGMDWHHTSPMESKNAGDPRGRQRFSRETARGTLQAYPRSPCAHSHPRCDPRAPALCWRRNKFLQSIGDSRIRLHLRPPLFGRLTPGSLRHGLHPGQNPPCPRVAD